MNAPNCGGVIYPTHEAIGFELTVAIVAWLERMGYDPSSVRAGMIRSLASPQVAIEGDVGEPAFRALMISLMRGRPIAMSAGRAMPDSPEWLGEHALVHADGNAELAIERLSTASRFVQQWQAPAAAEDEGGRH